MLTSPKTVVVCGIAGVGKTYLVSRVTARFSGIAAWRASVIIQNARQTADPDALRGLSQDEITQSQELLVLGFHQMQRGFGGRLIMLDAHSVIDTDRGFYEIDVDVMRRLQPHVFVHVEDDVEAIRSRRLNDSTRARPLRSAPQLARYQERSLELCKTYGEALSIAVVRIRSGDEGGLSLVIERLLTQ